MPCCSPAQKRATDWVIYGLRKCIRRAACLCVLLYVSVCLYWRLALAAVRWRWFYGPHCLSLIHFSQCWWILMSRHGVVGAKGMLCPGTDIDLIDKQWPQSLAYFSRVHLERCHTAHRASKPCEWVQNAQACVVSIFIHTHVYPHMDLHARTCEHRHIFFL